MRCTLGGAASARRTATTATATLGVGGDHAEGESYACGRRDESPLEVHNHSLIASAARPGLLAELKNTTLSKRPMTAL
jgi:hypothetical protein